MNNNLGENGMYCYEATDCEQKRRIDGQVLFALLRGEKDVYEIQI